MNPKTSKNIAAFLILVGLIGLIITLLCSGCVVAKVKKVYPDGTMVEAELHQTMWQRKGLELNYSTNELHLKVDESGAQSNPVQDATALLKEINNTKP